MFVYRSIVLGMLGACCLLLAMRPPIAIVTSAPGQILVASSSRELPAIEACASPTATIIDVAPGVTSTQLAMLLRLMPDERIASIDDVPVTSTLDALATLERADTHRGRYLDLAVTNATTERRVLVLMH